MSWLLASGGQSIGASAHSSLSPCSYPAMTHTYLGTPAPLHPLGPISSPAYSRKPSLLPVPLWNIPDASTLGGMPGPCSVSQAGRKASHLPLPTLTEPSPALTMCLSPWGLLPLVICKRAVSGTPDRTLDKLSHTRKK